MYVDKEKKQSFHNTRQEKMSTSSPTRRINRNAKKKPEYQVVHENLCFCAPPPLFYSEVSEILKLIC